ncbi:zinc-ribbon domain-containing protein [Pseudophaeobacter flagellatus]|uniref:zinc-ribbon domain-containing protein n=1 Tax=Pseudophaeobacter flagellatus TaxID=2899119 RepID=UPI001E4AFA10|nr:zinc-ribbon domain-containing protein [Pseudophaeobacter flagellatus]MCD9148224.1 zinc-ribbon domain-containing protein [Pseudophaeobacter flagellatus]
MRLTCPNCGAQYEVPDDVIPPEGRDVQCSNCADTWFQRPAGFVADTDPGEVDPTAAAQTPPQPESQPDPEPVPGPEPKAPAATKAEAPDQPPASHGASDAKYTAPETEEPAEPEAPPAATTAATDAADPASDEAHDKTSDAADPAPQPRGLDPALSDILREEAERETTLRAADQGKPRPQPLETQSNLGLDDLPEDGAAQRSRQAQDRMARLRGEDPRRLAAEASGLKRGVLPDIEEINSTLRTADTPMPPPGPNEHPAPRRKSGFTRGFALVILLVVVLVMTYSNASQIAEVIPQADPYLSSYVTWMDQARLWLDAQVSALQQPQI